MLRDSKWEDGQQSKSRHTKQIR